MTVTFTIPGEPVGKGRPRFAKGRTYTPAKTAAYEAHVKSCARKAFGDGPPFSGPIRVCIQAVFGTRKSWARRKLESLIWRHHTQTPDLSNVVKAVEDGMNGIAYADDAQVAEIEASKIWGDVPRVVVSVKQIGG